MTQILGLDISTSIVGVCVLDSQSGAITLLDHIDFKKCVTLFDKADKVQTYLTSLKQKSNISEFAVEEPLMGFAKGMSSASTITTLMRFNGICSYIARNTFGMDPNYISASHARKVCGIKMKRFKDCNMSQKDQVFKHMREHDLKSYTWPNKKKSDKVVDWAKDETDAYVIAKAQYILNTK